MKGLKMDADGTIRAILKMATDVLRTESAYRVVEFNDALNAIAGACYCYFDKQKKKETKGSKELEALKTIKVLVAGTPELGTNFSEEDAERVDETLNKVWEVVWNFFEDSK